MLLFTFNYCIFILTHKTNITLNKWNSVFADFIYFCQAHPWISPKTFWALPEKFYLPNVSGRLHEVSMKHPYIFLKHPENPLKISGIFLKSVNISLKPPLKVHWKITKNISENLYEKVPNLPEENSQNLPETIVKSSRQIPEKKPQISLYYSLKYLLKLLDISPKTP